MSPLQAVQTCFTKYTDFSGRATRQEYWWFGAFVVGGMIVLIIADYVAFGEALQIGNYVLLPMSELFALVTLLPGWAVAVRRMQDVGQNGQIWFWLLAAIYVGSYGTTFIDIMGWFPEYEVSAVFLVMAVGVVIVLIAHLTVAVKRSQDGDNMYGPNPFAGIELS